MNTLTQTSIKSRPFLSLLMLSFCLLMAIPSISQNKHKKVLYLGNSYTASNNLPLWVEDIASAFGDTITYQSITPGGQHFLGHSTDPQVLSAIQQGGWDYIILQEQSQIPVIPYYRDNYMIPGATAINNLRIQYAPNAKILFFLTWGREMGGQQCVNSYCSFPFIDFYGYQDTLTWAYQHAADILGASVAPVGEIWRECMLQHQGSYPPMSLFSGDGSHPSEQGTYIAALSIYSAIFERYVLASQFIPSNIDPSLTAFIRAVVDANIWPRKTEWRLTGGPTGVSQCADSANIYSFTFNGKSYEVIRELQTWANAADCAVQRGGRLVEINSQQEQDTVYDAVINGAGVSPTYISIANGGGIAYVWIGATDQLAEGTWLWDGDNDGVGINFWTGQGANGANNGVPIGGAFINWGGKSAGVIREPDDYGAGQDCAALALAGWPAGSSLLGAASEWNDIICSSMLYYVVEYDSLITAAIPKTKNKIHCYPNPASTHFTVSGADVRRVELFDLSGRVVLSSTESIVHLNGVDKGLYLIRVSVTDGSLVQKIIVQ